MPTHISETRIILLPKIPNPQKVSDFRPISCCNVVYKTISKLLCMRLKEVLPYLIDHSQSAFVKGRELLFNVLICQDLARGYTRATVSPRCILKIDLQKAFDSVHWDFLREMLQALHFPSIYVKWVMECISSITYRICINGEDSESFPGGRGLRQGDPISPLMFVITMEYLSRMLNEASQDSKFKLHPGCRKLKLTHLMFADDLMTFSKAEVSTLSQILNILDWFHKTAGLQANMSKSQMVIGGCNEELYQACMKEVGLTESTFPLKYLGVPITSSRLSKLNCRDLVDKMKARIQIWTSRHFSYAG